MNIEKLELDQKNGVKFDSAYDAKQSFITSAIEENIEEAFSVRNDDVLHGCKSLDDEDDVSPCFLTEDGRAGKVQRVTGGYRAYTSRGVTNPEIYFETHYASDTEQGYSYLCPSQVDDTHNGEPLTYNEGITASELRSKCGLDVTRIRSTT